MMHVHYIGAKFEGMEAELPDGAIMRFIWCLN